MGLLSAENSLTTGGCPLGTHTDLSQHLGHAVAGLEVIVDYQSAQALQLHCVFLLMDYTTQGEIKAHGKDRTLFELALHFDSASHHVHGVLGNGHAQARTLDAAYSSALLSLKGVKEMLQKRLTHADAAIAYDEIIMGIAGLFRSLLTDSEGHYAADRGKFGRVAQNINEHLIQTQGIENQLLILHVNSIHIKLHALSAHLRTYHIHQIMDPLG